MQTISGIQRGISGWPACRLLSCCSLDHQFPSLVRRQVTQEDRHRQIRPVTAITHYRIVGVPAVLLARGETRKDRMADAQWHGVALHQRVTLHRLRNHQFKRRTLSGWGIPLLIVLDCTGQMPGTRPPIGKTRHLQPGANVFQLRSIQDFRDMEQHGDDLSPHYNEAMARICILGGTGFVGRTLSSKLVTQGHQVRVLTRQHANHRSLLVLPTLELVQTDPLEKTSLTRHTAGMDVIVNLIGILNESSSQRQQFNTVHTRLAKTLVSVCHANNTPRLLQMSALGANRNARSNYLRSKAEAEAALSQFSGTTQVTAFRPSIIFGPGDQFVNRFATLLKFSPGFFPLACPDTRFAPVYVGDVVDRMCAALDDRQIYRKSFDLCGPDVYTFKELVERVAAAAGLRRQVIGLSPFLSRLQARILARVPGKPMTMDNYHSLQVDSICTDATPCPTHLEPVIREMLGQG